MSEISGLELLKTRRSIRSYDERPIEENVLKEIFEVTRWCFSAVNRQPWRFKIDGNAISIFLDKSRNSYKISRRLDCGIAMLHLELGARYSGIKGSWTFPPDSIACFFGEPDRIT